MGSIVYVTDYPLYGIEAISQGAGGLVVLAGGGGAAKTGVPNTLEVISVVGAPARRICSITQEDGAFANLAFHPREMAVAAGTDGVLKLFSLEGEGFSAPAGSVSGMRSTSGGGAGRKGRRTSSLSTAQALTAPAIVPMAKQDTDFSAEDQFQRVVRFSHDGTRLATGGSDGTLRVWEFPSLRRTLKVPLVASAGAGGAGIASRAAPLIQDLDFDHVGARIAVCAGDGPALIFRAVDGSREASLTWYANNNNLDDASVFKCCRFGSVQGVSMLFTAVNPVRSSAKARKHSVIVQWDVGTWRERRSRQVSQESLCALTVSRDGSMVAAGDMEGFVFVHNAADLSPLQKVRAHGLFVTGLTFIRDSEAAASSSSSSSSSTAPTHVLSISADRACVKTCVHRSAKSTNIVFLFAFILFALALLFFVNMEWMVGSTVPTKHTEV